MNYFIFLRPLSIFIAISFSFITFAANEEIIIAINPGHGLIFDDSDDTWKWQRKEFHGIREDLITPEFAIIFDDLLLQEGLSTIPLRELDKNKGIGKSGLAKWKESTKDFLRAKEVVPEYIWNTTLASSVLGKDRYSKVLYSEYLDADAIISIHTNGSIAGDLTGEGDKTGTQTFFCNQENNINNPESILLANAIHNSIVNSVQTRFDRYWNDGGVFPFNHSENCLAKSPAIIVEIGFHDRSFPDALYLQDPHFKQVVSEGMKEGIKEYFAITSISIVPSASSKPIITNNLESQQIQIEWDEIDPNYSYRLYRCETNEIETCKEIYSGKQASFNDSKAIENMTYYYRTKSCNLTGCDELFSEYAVALADNSVLPVNSGGGLLSMISIIILFLFYLIKLNCKRFIYIYLLSHIRMFDMHISE